jgi:hypothetical protein
MNVHRLAARNMAKWEFVEQQNCLVWEGQWSVDYVFYSSPWSYSNK